MLGRQELEKREFEILTEGACKSAESKGRQKEEASCPLRTVFQRDRDRIVHSKAFRRLMHKTQVFLSPEGDHYRTRLTHTLEVAQISRTISRALGLNEDLTEAIALGHDLGHTPFGHNGEAILNEIHALGFHHNEQSIRVVDRLEKRHGRRGLNLTWEVRDGILGHTGKHIPRTLEGQVVRTSDRIAYINHDIDDALRSGVIAEQQLPKDCIDHLGADHRTRIDTLVKDMITASDGKPAICQSEDTAYYMNQLRQFMFKNVYYNDAVKKASDLEQVEETVRFLYEYYIKHWEEMPVEYVEMTREDGVEEMVKDYVAGMTDRYAATLFQEKTKK